MSKWYRHQPLDYVKEYFGVKIGLYFAWLGYYTYMLLLASVVGFGCFLYSVLTLPYDIPSQEICNGIMSNTTMCPLCDKLCDYWPLKDSCMHIKITYLFDNKATVFFAVFMSFWGKLNCFGRIFFLYPHIHRNIEFLITRIGQHVIRFLLLDLSKNYCYHFFSL